MTGTQRALLQAIVTTPADDTARLVYADYLEENGDAVRAEFIRVQVELARMPFMGLRQNDPRYMLPEPWERLRHREREILDDPHPVGNYRIYSNRLGWTEDYRQWAKCEFRRGFISSITCSAADFLKHADKLIWHPDAGDRCVRCDGSGLCDAPPGDIARKWPCDSCSGTPGYIPRPFPDTAQPIEEVTLTDSPNWMLDELEPGDDIEKEPNVCVHPKYPGVKFRLPREPLLDAYGNPFRHGFM